MEILSIKQSNKTITLISNAGKKLDERIHQVGVSGIAHFLQHGDLTVLTGLAKAMPRSSRGNALKFWITKNVKVKWSSTAYSGKGGFVKNGDTELSSWDKFGIVVQADASPFYAKKDKEASQWNPDTSILSLVNKLNSYKKDHALHLSEKVKRELLAAIA